MSSGELSLPPVSGFNFENCRRNAFLKDKGYKPPTTVKTGTTICAVVFKDGVVLGADTRCTAGGIVMDKYTSKIHPLAPNMFCCGAGTAADCTSVTRLIKSQLKLHRLETGRQSRIATAVTLLSQRLFQYQGHIEAYLIIGGVDATGPHLSTVMAHGSCMPTKFVATGSGTLGATAELESRYKPDMTEQEAKDLVHDAILAGVFNDLGSGSNVDLAVVKANDDVQYFQPYDVANKKGERKNKYQYPKGTTAVIREVQRPIIVESVEIRPVEPMSS